MRKVRKQIVISLIRILIIFSFFSCKNDNSQDQIIHIYEEINFIDSKIDTILYRIELDFSISSIKPSIYSKDILLFYTNYRSIIPQTDRIDTICLLDDEKLIKLESLSKVINNLHINTNTQKDYQDFLNRMQLKEFDKDRSILEIKRFELSLVLDLFISHSIYKS